MELEEQFEQALLSSRLLSQKPDNETLLELYSLYKQSTEGDNSFDEPANPFDVVSKAKYNAWSKLKGVSKEEAIQRYVDLISKLQK